VLQLVNSYFVFFVVSSSSRHVRCRRETMKCDGEVRRWRDHLWDHESMMMKFKCDCASSRLGFFWSLHYLTNVCFCFCDFVLLFMFEINVPWHLVCEFCWSFGVLTCVSCCLTFWYCVKLLAIVFATKRLIDCYILDFIIVGEMGSCIFPHICQNSNIFNINWVEWHMGYE